MPILKRKIRRFKLISLAVQIRALAKGSAMKCPTCSDTEKQQSIGSLDGEPAGYRCVACGRLYRTSPEEEAALIDRLEALKLRSAEIARQITEIESQLKGARGR